MAKTCDGISVPRGLQLRNGEWVIYKTISGSRFHKRLYTSDLKEACRRFDTEISAAAAKKQLKHKSWVETSWRLKIEEMLETRGSWLYKTHGRLVIRGKASGKGCRMTFQQFVNLMMESNGKCAVTGLPFSDEIPAGCKIAPFKMSVDRIRCDEGYHYENCRVVCLTVNLAMRDWGDGVMVKIAKAMMLKQLQEDIG